MQTLLQQNRIARNTLPRTAGAFGDKIGIMGTVFGCWHKNLTRPFTIGEQISYRACIECGARRRFDTQTLKTFGAFYYPPTVSPSQ